MSDVIDRLRSYVYPRRLTHGRLYASDLLLGMIAVMLVVLLLAHAITLAVATA